MRYELARHEVAGHGLSPHMSARPSAPDRSAFKIYRPITLRWMDNDVFGHVNNVTYYSFFDTVVCGHLIECRVFHATDNPIIGVVVESSCTYFSSVAFPDQIEGALAVDRVGNSSVQYRLGVFLEGAETASATGTFTHVYVDRESRRPVPLPDDLRSVVEALKSSTSA